MKVSPQLEKMMTKAVQTSMRIEGYRATPSAAMQATAKALMEQRRVQVSVPNK